MKHLKSYMITSKIDLGILQKRLTIFKPDYVLFRDKECDDYALYAKKFVDVCSKNSSAKILLHQDIYLAKKLGVFGVHLTSKQIDLIQKTRDLGLNAIVSTHTHKDIEESKEQGCYAITYSPIFFSPNKGEPKGIEDLTLAANKFDIKIFALGGIIDDTQLELIKQSRAYGFASIRYFAF